MLAHLVYYFKINVLISFLSLFADNLTGLIQSATESNIEFVYALSPGLDISFSSAKDVQCLKRKLEQVFFLLARPTM